MKSLKLSKRMEQAVELMKQEEFYLCELPNWSFWEAYNLPGQTIRTDTMKALEHRGLVKIELATGEKRCSYVATLIKRQNSYTKNFNLVEEAQEHKVASDALWKIREEYVSLLTDFEILEPESIMKKRDELQERTAEVYSNSPRTDGKSYAEAQKALKNDEEQTFSENEINISGKTGGRKNNMQKVIEKAVIKITQEMERNRKAYNEARGSYNDTGYDRYYNKMTKLDAEYEELKAFLHPEEKSEVPAEVYRECDELRQMLRNLKSKWQYLRADLPVSADTIGIDDLLRDVR